MPKILGKFPSVPEYYAEHIDNTVDLTQNPKQCCPFHKENTPSFSYNLETGRWSCFGKCHAHGGVVEMHMRWAKLDSLEEARSSLMRLYGVRKVESLDSMANDKPYVSEEKIENDVVYAQAVAMANCPERWLQLDYVMSISPYDRNRVEELIASWKGIKYGE